MLPLSPSRLFVALPVYNEPDLARCLDSLRQQTHKPDRILVCINHPETYNTDPVKKAIVLQNRWSLSELSQAPDIECIDRCSIGQGWPDRKHGVGWARKVLMDALSESAQPHDLIISVDADTYYPPDYFSSLVDCFTQTPTALALSNPYYHALSGQEAEDRAMLRYEIYMRLYELHLRRIGSPYAFTALGSAMVVRVDAYRRMGGLSPKSSGEDFYFLQQLSKMGLVLRNNSVCVFPGVRFSDRVYFGTGPAMIKGHQGDWHSYPLYHPLFFDELASLQTCFNDWYTDPEGNTAHAAIKVFLDELIPLSMRVKWKEQSKDSARFIKFCYEKFDGLRHLQYVKRRHAETSLSDQAGLEASWLVLGLDPQKLVDIEQASVGDLNTLRDHLFDRLQQWDGLF